MAAYKPTAVHVEQRYCIQQGHVIKAGCHSRMLLQVGCTARPSVILYNVVRAFDSSPPYIMVSGVIMPVAPTSQACWRHVRCRPVGSPFRLRK